VTLKKRKIRPSPSPRKPARKEALKHRSGAIAAYDQAVVLISDIRALAGLLEAVGVRRDAEPIEAALASSAGSLIVRHVDQLHAALRDSLQKTLKRLAS